MQHSAVQHSIAMKIHHSCLLIPIVAACLSASETSAHHRPGEIWRDTAGNPINAHGGGLLLHGGVHYWFGEIKSGPTRLVPGQSWECYRVEAGGISCYSSSNLRDWKFKGVALAPDTLNPHSDLHTSRVLERPKVIFNERTRKFVMWLHVDTEDYAYSRAGVAVSDSPAGPYTYMGSLRPNGQMSRDMTLFKDDDGRAYHVFSSENNATMHIGLLTDDYLAHTGVSKRIFIGKSREAPALFKHRGKYHLITSGCTGWSPNPALLGTADSILGEWTELHNPCRGSGSETTFDSQSTFVLPIPGRPDEFIFMADRWNKTDLENSRYVWLPLSYRDGKMVVEWRDVWSIPPAFP